VLEASGGSGPPKARVLWTPTGTGGVNRRAVSLRSLFAHEPRVVFRDNKRATSSSAGTTTRGSLALLPLSSFFLSRVLFRSASLFLLSFCFRFSKPPSPRPRHSLYRSRLPFPPSFSGHHPHVSFPKQHVSTIETNSNDPEESRLSRSDRDRCAVGRKTRAADKSTKNHRDFGPAVSPCPVNSNHR